MIDAENRDPEPTQTCKPTRRFDSKLKQSINQLINARHTLDYDYFSTKDIRGIKEEIICVKKLDAKLVQDEDYLKKSDDVFINLEILQKSLVKHIDKIDEEAFLKENGIVQEGHISLKIRYLDIEGNIVERFSFGREAWMIQKALYRIF